MRSATVQAGQTLLDVTIQSVGSAEAVFAVAALNGLPVTAELVAGRALQLPDELADKRVVTQYQRQRLAPAANITGDGQGIGYWTIEQDFIVS
jgi:hypothetical protein